MRARLVISVLVVLGLAYGAMSGWHYLLRHAQTQLRATVPLVFDDDAAEARLPSFEAARTSKSYELTGGRQVTIDNPFGNVSVSSSGSKVAVESVVYTHAKTREAAAAKAASFRVMETREEGDGLALSVTGDTKIGHVTVDLTVRVPPDVSLQVKAASGNVQVADLRGPVAVEVESGDIDVQRLGGSAELSTQSGNVVVQGASRGLVAHTSSGHLRLRDVSGDTSAAIESGNIDLTVVSSRQVTARCQSGDVSVAVLQPFSGRLEARTESGNATASLPPTSNCRVSVNTSSGIADCTLPLQELSRSSQTITGRLGTGAGQVTVSTSSGNATLRGAASP
jgi:Toastrack DUF4097